MNWVNWMMSLNWLLNSVKCVARKTTRSTWTTSGAGCWASRNRCAPVAWPVRKSAACRTGPSGASARASRKRTWSSRASASSSSRRSTAARPARPSSKSDPVSIGWLSRIASAGTCPSGRPVNCRPMPNADPESPSEVFIWISIHLFHIVGETGARWTINFIFENI